MKLRFAGAATLLLALAACDPMGQQPISEEIFVNGPAADTTAATPLPGAALPPASGGQNTPGDVADPALEMVEQDPYGQVVQNASSGLTERLPDTCKLETFQYLMGLTPAAVAAAGFSEPYRIVGPNDIVSQEYNPLRVNFYTDERGQINRIICG
ncbi:I78 family peptidase inhibitor [Tropicimonas sp. IMCC34043]|uniref:I78 family peptidase inhibitor n=1 Tax=Tropicimonas sp. IMCC34043 TaxID=2248760 RepID=UPI0013004D2A|nr:I78 family peptidase inhibitor [Tropicimonas sp. IMCC34043]